MLDLLALLQARHHWRGADLAERLGVSHRTLRRDVDRLRDLGYPVDGTRGLDGGYQLGPGGRLPPLLLSTDEAVAATIGLRSAASQPIAGIADDAISALLKITQLLPARQRSEAEAVATAVDGPAAQVDDVPLDTLTTIARARRDGELLRFGYRTHAGAAGDRHVEPHHVVPLSRRWYLVAWDLDRDDWRTFRLDRIAKPRPTGRRFEPRALPAPDPATYVTRSIASIPSSYHVDVVVEAPLQAVHDVLGRWGTATTEGPGTTRLTMDVDALSWPVMFLAALNAKVHHVEPAELRALLLQLAEHFTCAAEPDGGQRRHEA
jgi:predicted DNA-binding transcriptional regulator YafY